MTGRYHSIDHCIDFYRKPSYSIGTNGYFPNYSHHFNALCTVQCSYSFEKWAHLGIKPYSTQNSIISDRNILSGCNRSSQNPGIAKIDLTPRPTNSGTLVDLMTKDGKSYHFWGSNFTLS